jgi:ATP-binding cassette subfamily B protein
MQAFALVLAISLFLAALGAAQPLLTRLIIDRGLLARRFDVLVAACIGILCVAMLGLLLGAWHRRIYVSVSGGMLFQLRADAYAHLLRVPPCRHGELSIGDLVSRLDGDIGEVQRFATDTVLAALGSVLVLLITAGVMLTLAPQLALLVAVVLPLQLIVRRATRQRIAATTAAVREQAGRIGGFFVSTLSAIRTVQGAAAESTELRNLKQLSQTYLDRVQRQQLVGYATGAGTAMVGHMATAVVFVTGGWFVLGGSLTVGTLIAFVAYLGRGAGSASGLFALYTGYQRALVSLGRIQTMRALPILPELPGQVVLNRTAMGAISFEDIVFRYDNRTPLLCGAKLSIPAGSKVSIHGESGAGKSTLVDLLRRFADPDSGRILLDGCDLRNYELRSLRRHIAVVDQSPVLLPGTLLDNLRYGSEHVSEREVLRAADQSGLAEFIASLHLGYGTSVGEAGALLSVGQRQRIAIARALLADPVVLVLDEATTGIDPSTACAIEAAIDRHFGNRTRIVITHRPDSLIGIDMAIRLVAGRLETFVERAKWLGDWH